LGVNVKNKNEQNEGTPMKNKLMELNIPLPWTTPTSRQTSFCFARPGPLVT